MKNFLCETALEYINVGMSVFPLQERSKIPLTAHGFLDASKDPQQIRTWWQQWPNANIGIATGPASGFWVLDIDGDVGEQSLRNFENQYSPLPPTREVITGSGGRHLYFQWTSFLNFSISAGQLGTGLDIRGRGGYIVAPPSIHPNGRTYESSVDSSDMIAMAPDWLISLVQTSPKAIQKKSPVDWVTMLKGVQEGCRNDCLTRLVGKLLAHGLDSEFVFYLAWAWNEARCVPPLPQDEFIRTFISVYKMNAKKLGGYHG